MAAAGSPQDRVSNATPRSHNDRSKFKDLFSVQNRSNPVVEQAVDQVGGTNSNVIVNVVQQNDRYGDSDNLAVNLLESQFNSLSD
jgi:hypothetical protein